MQNTLSLHSFYSHSADSIPTNLMQSADFDVYIFYILLIINMQTYILHP